MFRSDGSISGVTLEATYVLQGGEQIAFSPFRSSPWHDGFFGEIIGKWIYDVRKSKVNGRLVQVTGGSCGWPR